MLENSLLFDFISGTSIVLLFISIFLVLAIVSQLGAKESYVLAKGWWFLLPAVLVVAFIRLNDYFIVYGFFSRRHFIYEVLYLVFSVFLFTSLLVQFLAIKQTIEGRKK